VNNALSVVRYAKSLDFVTQLYLCGHSQGGLLTMLIGGMCADDFKAILPLSPAWMIPDITRHGVVLGQSFDAQHIPEKIFLINIRAFHGFNPVCHNRNNIACQNQGKNSQYAA
jgi:alpha-beta hydrolase superfamily lysophospholipase